MNTHQDSNLLIICFHITPFFRLNPSNDACYTECRDSIGMMQSMLLESVKNIGGIDINHKLFFMRYAILYLHSKLYKDLP